MLTCSYFLPLSRPRPYYSGIINRYLSQLLKMQLYPILWDPYSILVLVLILDQNYIWVFVDCCLWISLFHLNYLCSCFRYLFWAQVS